MDQSASGCLKVKLGGLDLLLHILAPFCIYASLPPLWLVPLLPFLVFNPILVSGGTEGSAPSCHSPDG